ncbi:hypothetical protein ASG17_09395 [Brevundimonas sp. Leaf363]|uniref:hypothetical protein n=1 Tax=Brevundimonas sp. Leaf363 TaxID=1736353 RepID=UPI0007005895|nr:hypothetical protein [Brevundimonas sp. Leaf363]KQS56222.1 hypothetical protein ASG17_09395 [Brevundimonas sp. Leaf363]
MNRRKLFAFAAVAAAGAATPALASGGGGGQAEAPALNIAGVGLPVIDGGRLRNYVFVSLRLHLGAGKTPQDMRDKEPFLRDALVRAAHRTPFTVPGSWTQLSPQALSASLIQSANTIAGRGSVARVEIITQSPRRQVQPPRA